MPIWFEGTSTRNKYQVGQAYEMGGEAYVAQRDGSFRNIESGQVLKGSAGNPEVRWFGSGPSLVGGAGASGGVAAAVASATPGARASAAPGPGAAPVANPQTVKATAANRGAFLVDMLRDSGVPWSGDEQEGQDLVLFGSHWKSSPFFSNAELGEMRYADIGSNLLGLVVLGGDAVYNTEVSLFGPSPENMSARQKVDAVTAKSAVVAEDLGDAFVSGLLSARDSALSWAVENKRQEDERARIRRELDEANDLRALLEFEEARKQFENSGLTDYQQHHILGFPDTWPRLVQEQY